MRAARTSASFKKGWIRKSLFVAIYSAYLVLICELVCRGYWYFVKEVPFFRTKEIATTVFYPQLREVRSKDLHVNDSTFDILLFGGSVLTEDFGDIGPRLEERLSHSSNKTVRVHNVAVEAHTSLDSYYKYVDLASKHFDLVVFYHAINEARANNCPPSVFRSDYSHYSWYRLVNQFYRHKEVNLLVLPYTMECIWFCYEEQLGWAKYIPPNAPNREWLKYGSEIKTTGSFTTNLRAIVELANKRQEKVLLMTFAVRDRETTPDDRKVIGMWGISKNVLAAVDEHNRVTKEVALSNSHVSFVDQNRFMSEHAEYFIDQCHFTPKGCEKFVENALPVITEMVQKWNPGTDDE